MLAITQPDRPVGRGRRLEPTPVKVRALELGVDVWQPAVVKGRRFAARVAALAPDFLITAAFGRLLGPSLLGVPRKACLNVHASLLPRYRGAAPINWAILDGESHTGISIMGTEVGLDCGPVYLTETTPIGANETAGELTDRLARLGAQALAQTLARFDSLSATAQDDRLVSWAPVLKKSDGMLDWTERATVLHNRARGLHPWPCATANFGERTIKIHSTRVLEISGRRGEPGTVITAGKSGIDVACGQGALRLLELQAPGKKRLPAAQFLAGTPIAVGTVWS